MNEDQRSLRSSRLRNALFAAAGGRCRRCGEELKPGWHADHIEPWVETKRTNVHEMQALCPACNLKKGATRMSKDRRHQAEMATIADQIVAGSRRDRKIVADVTPGGGKTRMSQKLATRLLDAGLITAVIHVVPRSALRRQVELDYLEHGQGYLLTRSTNDAPLFVQEQLPGGRVVGVVCTYDQLRSQPDLYRSFLRSQRTLLVCDEAGLLSADETKSWGPLAMSLHELSAFTLVMSGSLFRRRANEKIALVDYETRADGKEYAKADIRYTLAEAIGDYAIKPMEFVRLDGSVKYQLGDDEVNAVLSEDDGDAAKLGAFLDLATTWQPLVDMGLQHWANWRREVYPSRMIVVARNVDHADKISRYINEHHGIECAQATSDLDNAHEVIASFQGDRKNKQIGSPDVLVTVAMASIGFDVPDCTHMLYLSAYRSLPWALQAFARVTRIDPLCSLGAEFQTAFCFVPDDIRMVALIEWMRAETEQGVAQRRESPEDDLSEGIVGAEGDGDTVLFIPLASTPGAVTVDGRDGAFERDTSADVMAILGGVPEAAGIPPSKLAAILKFQRQRGDAALSSQIGPIGAPTVSPSDRKAALRSKLESTSRLIDFRTKQPAGTNNRVLRGMARKDRHELTDKELIQLIAYCEETLRHLPVRS